MPLQRYQFPGAACLSTVKWPPEAESPLCTMAAHSWWPLLRLMSTSTLRESLMTAPLSVLTVRLRYKKRTRGQGLMMDTLRRCLCLRGPQTSGRK